MKPKELWEKDKRELEDLERELQEKLFNFRFQLRAGKIKNVHLYKNTKRDIARIKTIISEK